MDNILEKLATEVDKISQSEVSASAANKFDDSDDSKENQSLMSSLFNGKESIFPQIGDIVEGKVLEIGTNELYVDLTPFGTGVVFGKEIKDGMGGGKLKIGDIVTATLIDTENEDGYIELSIREASFEKAWDDIESKRDTRQKITTKILSANKGGLLVEVNGISGFLPVSQLSSKNYPRVENGDKNKILSLLKRLVGQEVEVRIIDADRETQKLIVSEKSAQSERDKEMISGLMVGDVISGEISGVVDFGAFIKFVPRAIKNTDAESTPVDSDDEKKIEGLVHISELAWQLIENPRSIVKVGDQVKAKIIGIDDEKISLSIRALQKDPWTEVSEKYKIGDSVLGTVHKINPFGAFVYLDKDIHGLAHISEMSQEYPGKNIDELIRVGETYDWKILSIEPKEHRMGLVLIIKKKSGTKSKDNSINDDFQEKTSEEKIDMDDIDDTDKKEKSTKKKSSIKKSTKKRIDEEE